MSSIPREVIDAVTETYEAWQPYLAAVRVDDSVPASEASGDSGFAGAIERIDALLARIEYYRANPVFPTEEA